MIDLACRLLRGLRLPGTFHFPVASNAFDWSGSPLHTESNNERSAVYTFRATRAFAGAAEVI